MEPISFSVADIPPTADPDESPITSDDLTCEVCGRALSYSGRGRKPKFCDDHKSSKSSTSAPRGRRSTGDVEAAMAALDSAHTSLSFVLMLVAGDAAMAWNAERDALNARNRGILEADPKLAKKLATAASKGGGPALVLSHLIAAAPAAGLAYGKVRLARVAKAQEAAQPESMADVVDMNMRGAHAAPTPPGPASPIPDPDAAFKRGR